MTFKHLLIFALLVNAIIIAAVFFFPKSSTEKETKQSYPSHSYIMIVVDSNGNRVGAMDSLRNWHTEDTSSLIDALTSACVDNVKRSRYHKAAADTIDKYIRALEIDLAFKDPSVVTLWGIAGSELYLGKGGDSVVRRDKVDGKMIETLFGASPYVLPTYTYPSWEPNNLPDTSWEIKLKKQ